MTSFPVVSPDFVAAMERDSRRLPTSSRPNIAKSNSSSKLQAVPTASTAQSVQRHVSQPANALPTSSMQLSRQMPIFGRKSMRLSSSAVDVFDMPRAGPSNLHRVSPAASFRSSEAERDAAAASVPATDHYRFNYATSPLAPRQAIRSPSRTPPMNSPDCSRFPGGSGAFGRPSMRRDSSAEYYNDESGQREASTLSPAAVPASVKNRRRLSEQSFASSHSLSTSLSQAMNFGTLIGSYEESLLSGRMSTMPSKPLMFDAELGVLGSGKCKAALRCPPHVSFTFPAHFYNLDGARAEKEGEVSPSSPYVGTIDLDSHYIDQLLHDNVDSHDVGNHSSARGEKHDAKPSFPGYRVPPKGQIQLVIKNPHLTAVKVFLVPYDLTDMPAGTKTFVRQKCHFTKPFTPRASPKMSTATFDADGASPNASREVSRSPSASKEKPASRDALRYAVHLQFCAVSGNATKKAATKGDQAGFAGVNRIGNNDDEAREASNESPPRIYLHKAIRVVFSARVPDKSEKATVTNDTPRFSDAKGGANMYSEYSGPSDEWCESRKIFKKREAERKLADDRRARDFALAFGSAAANPDPNGERLDHHEQAYFARREDNTSVGHASRNGDESDVGSEHGAVSEAIGIPPRSGRSWHSQQRSPLLQSRAADPVPQNNSEVPVARSFHQRDARVHSPSRRREGSLHIPLGSAVQSVPASAPLTTPPLSEQRSDDRALLDQFHASLSLRAQQHTPTFGVSPVNGGSSTSLRPASPTSTRFIPTSPPMNPSSAQSFTRHNGNSISHGQYHAHSAQSASASHNTIGLTRTPSKGMDGSAPRHVPAAPRLVPQSIRPSAATTTSALTRPGFARRISSSSSIKAVRSQHQQSQSTENLEAQSSTDTPDVKASNQVRDVTFSSNAE